MLTGPWGLEMARAMMKSKYRSFDASEEQKKYWMHSYRIEGLIHLKKLVETTMVKETFNAVDQPVFLAYYYKNEEEQDEIVKVSAMREMFDQLGVGEFLGEARLADVVEEVAPAGMQSPAEE